MKNIVRNSKIQDRKKGFKDMKYKNQDKKSNFLSWNFGFSSIKVRKLSKKLEFAKTIN